MVSVKSRVALLTLAVLVVAATAFEAAARAATPVPASSDGSVLNVTIPVFDPGIPADPSVFRDLQVFPRIRQIEAMLMPFLLRETLVKSGRWGAVRVTTKPDDAEELQIFGTIVRSDGDWLELRVRAVDATGSTWLDKIFSSEASDETAASHRDRGTPEFQAIYDDVANELTALRARLDEATVANIKGTSLMRYAAVLAPSAFSDYLEQNDDGTFRLLRLPARNDPMLIRIETVRNTEFLITDTVDARFRAFNKDLARTYRVWRQYRRKVADYEAWNTNFAAAGPGDAERGSWESIKHQYDAYKYDRLTAQERDRLAVAFNNEVATTVDAMEARVAELNGWVEQGYPEWSRLLEGLYEIETPLPDTGAER
ncbi:MAG: hypothetical protein KJO31_11810 [Gammaproteobacteria bacterium]|nr:hypothetical protein [Gammaproteobacteria bacterium]